MRALALIALLLPLTAEAGMLGGGKGLVRARTSPVAARYVPRVGQAFVGERGEAVTVTRASTKNCLVNGVWTSAATNTACIGDAGLSVEGARTNKILYSADLYNAAWVKAGTASVANDAVASPDGSTAGRTVTLPGGGTNYVQQVLGTATFTGNAVLAPSVFIKRVSTSGIVRMTNASDGTKGDWSINLALLGSGWERITAAHAAVTVNNAFVATAGGAAGLFFYSPSGSLSFAAWGAQQEEGASASSYIATTTTPVTRAADVVTAPHGIASGSRWCVRWVGALPSWSPSSLSGLWQLGSTTPNLARMFVTTTKAYLLVSDAAGGELTQSWTHGFADGSRHSITACSDSAGAMTISVDGAAVTPTASGAGTGIIGAMPATMLIGSYAATRESNGSTESVTTCNASVASECL